MSNPSHAMIRPDYRPDIDGLRAMAVLSVVGYHAFPGWIGGGFIGVDIFFVISGFLISGIIFKGLAGGGFDAGDFYSRRIRRIFPALILVLAVSYIIGWNILSPIEYQQFGKHLFGGAGFLSNWFFLRETGYFDIDAALKPLLHLWSLGVEEQFYLLWPFLLWAAWRLRVNLLALTFALIVISFLANLSYAHHANAAAFYAVQSRFWELLAGSVLAYNQLFPHGAFAGRVREMKAAITGRIGQREWCNLQAAAGMAVIAFGILAINRENAYSIWRGLIPVLGACALIAAGPAAWVNRTILSHKVMVWVGLISYPLYLWHWPLLSFARIVTPETPSPALRGALVALSIGLAWLTYRFIERPVRFSRRSPLYIFALCLPMLCLGVTGYVTYRQEGFKSRFPEILQQIFALHSDYDSLFRMGTADYRIGTCCLRAEQDASEFTGCTSTPTASSQPSVWLWGDSHATSLYPGFKKRFGKNSKVTELTAYGCPPILDVEPKERPHCRGINDYVLERLSREKPDRVFLAAVWPDYEWKKIDVTIQALHRLGIKNIILVGPLPQWKDGLPNQLYHYVRANPQLTDIPSRMVFGLNPDIAPLDREMAAYAQSAGIHYISPYRLLCDADGCLTKLGDGVEALTAWDYGHLTTLGSEYLVAHFSLEGTHVRVPHSSQKAPQ